MCCYQQIIAAPKEVDLEALSAVDREGIMKGKALEGMTKRGVRIALGYPATHETPSLDSNVWTYWTNRFRRMTVGFSERGFVK